MACKHASKYNLPDEALVFGVPKVLVEDHIECLHQYQRGWWIEDVSGSVMDVDIRHLLPGAGSFSNGPSNVIARVERFSRTGDRAKL